MLNGRLIDTYKRWLKKAKTDPDLVQPLEVCRWSTVCPTGGLPAVKNFAVTYGQSAVVFTVKNSKIGLHAF